jgi:DNA helicase-4
VQTTLLILLVVIASFAIGRQQWRSAKIKKLLLALRQYEQDFRSSIQEFENLGKRHWYISDRQYREWKAKYQYLADLVSTDFLDLQTNDPFKKLIVDFANYHSNGRQLFIDPFNENFVKEEAPTIRKILDTKEIKHNSDQVTAIASDEDNTLLVAGAGTGKTTTILGKLAYLTERVGIQSEDILLLSFTGRAVDELTERIGKKFPVSHIEARTFHSFGLSIIGQAQGKKPDLAFARSADRQMFLDEQFDALLKNPEYLKRAVEYFAYYFKPVVLKPGFHTLDDYYKYAKTEENLTLRKESMKSQQEVMIANFLYLNGVNYIYEKPYQHETADKSYQQYKPDFYLPDHGIYIEHFGVDRHGRTHFTNNESQNASQSRKYQADMAWKRELHEKYRTTLVETFSFEFAEGGWKEKLTEQLKLHNVQFSDRNIEEVFKTLEAEGSVKEITQLFATFLDLSKSNGYDPLKLQSIVSARNNPREQAFIDIFVPLYEAYEAQLNRTGTIDFHDMLIKAAAYVREGHFASKFKYIIIDEFQDFSVSKYVLIKALCEQNPETKLFCVGDDWQSIFRFAGSDISLMTSFEASYGFTRKNQLVLTNRFANGLAVISNKFILKNPNQIDKEVRSEKPDIEDAVEIRYRKNRDETEELLQEIFNTLNRAAQGQKKPTSVFLLGRYNHNKPKKFTAYAREFKNLSIEYLTIHGSKGAEADYVVILDVISGKYGLPSEITDDPLLEIVLSKSDSYPHAEERRLMYVAMTRARRKVFIITQTGNESVFVLELQGSKNPDVTKRCLECGGEMTDRKGPYGTFLGCSNFPDCRYKVNLQSQRRTKRGYGRRY